MSDSLRPHGLQPSRLLHPWDFPGKSTGVGCHCLVVLVDTKVLSCSYLTLCTPLDCSPPSPSVPGIFQARILESWIFSPRGSSRPRDQTRVSCISSIVSGFFACPVIRGSGGYKASTNLIKRSQYVCLFLRYSDSFRYILRVW